MQNVINALRGLPHGLEIPQIPFNQVNVAANVREIFALAGEKIIQHAHLMPQFQQFPRDV